MSTPPEHFLKVWDVQEFYKLIKFHAWEAHASEEYRKLMAAKINK